MRIPICEVTPDCGHAHIAGWVHEERALGGLTFLLVRDRTGILQITIPKKKVTPEVLDVAKQISRESVIEVEGEVKATEKAPGGRELIPEKITIISKAQTPLPLDVSEKVPAELDTRLDNRYLDLRKPAVNAIFQIRSATLHAISEYLWDHGFIQAQTPKIVAAATEGGTELFPLAYFDKEAFLNQSPQLFKQMLMSSGFERVFEIGPIFRAEEHNTVRHLNEATSIDIEMSFADQEDAMSVLENVVAYAYQYVKDHCAAALETLGITDFKVPTVPFPRITYQQAIEISTEGGEPLSFGDDLSSAAERVIGEKMGTMYFITEWPSSTRPFYTMPFLDRPEVCRAFDMMHPRMELSSGAQRCHIYDLLVQQIKDKGMNPDSFEFYLNPFKYGMPPHAGWGLGAERLIMTMLDLQNIREGVLFPRDRHRVSP
ncbi:MAG TPA: aspartate--tRNA(Asn) ligase [Methanocorpusculum sp.]|nr:aspartate--tRNA(Asn) ligase [Methanocorpusculum sp.]HJJ40042.1 aspartate--tRNA(Asn) ligase [Methanocorpusculum sp.]HJJ49525.1 aspartate--tRNA(Asn) ligase [Methanocorpusculum sp.]HJJ57077.1 aspartate--tRNA(Asn) ligase [Methanocorpusculum sp.]HJJ95007.1 aspartate--tRNA(Asn) ligase [Methanocorpusculum sp.]